MSLSEQFANTFRALLASAASVGGAVTAWLDHVQTLVSIVAGLLSIASACYAIAVARKTLKARKK